MPRAAEASRKIFDLRRDLMPTPIRGGQSRARGNLLRESGVIASDDDAYRYVLWRVWDETLPLAAFVMLNPSVADEEKSDPTLAKCVHFANRWGLGGVILVNLFALRSTDPAGLMAASDPVGEHNPRFVNAVLEHRAVGLTVLAWGNGGVLDARDESFMVLHGHRDLWCLEPPGKEALTRLGAPRHPGRIGYACKLRRLRWEGAIVTGELR